MKVLLVSYSRSRPHDDPEQAPQFLQAAEKISGLPGLIWKLWTYDDEAERATNVYLFESEEQARAWGDGPLRPALSGYDGVADVEVVYMDVDETLSAATRAPLPD